MFDKCIDQHKKPVCLLFHLIGFIIGIYGLWVHSWTWIVIAIILYIIGHLLVGGQKKQKKEEPVSPPTEPEKPNEPIGPSV